MQRTVMSSRLAWQDDSHLCSAGPMKPHTTCCLKSLVALSLIVWGYGAAMLGAADLPAPVPLTPSDHAQITDVSSYFSWSALTDCSAYELQIAHDAAFTDIYKVKQTKDARYHEHNYFPKDMLPIGSYFWRVRGMAGEHGGAWSAPCALTVNADHSIAPKIIRPITAGAPIFLMRNRDWNPVGNSKSLREIIPSECQGIIVPDDIHIGDATQEAMDRAQAYEELGVDFVVWNNRARVSLSLLEYLFQHFKHCIGTAEGEHFWSWRWETGPEGNVSEWDYVPRAWTLCAKYGRYYFIGDGEYDDYKWTLISDHFKEELHRYHQNIVPMFKSTVGNVALHSLGAVEGLMAAGWVDNCGYWADEFVWGESGFGKVGEIMAKAESSDAKCPYSYDIQMWLMGIASGATVFHLESAHQWTDQGKGADNYQRYYLPFVSAVIKHGLIPSRAAFLQSLKAAVVCDLERAGHKHNNSYVPDFAFLKELYQLKNTPFQELIPDNSRYGIITLLPPGGVCLNKQTQIFTQEQLLAPGSALKSFDAAYPQRFQGDAFTWECDGTIIVTNCRENELSNQSFAMPLEHSPVTKFSGHCTLHQYIIGKVSHDGSSLWLQANDGLESSADHGPFPAQPMTFEFQAARKPHVIVTPASAQVSGAWDAKRQCYGCTISTKDGVVELTISQ